MTTTKKAVATPQAGNSGTQGRLGRPRDVTIRRKVIDAAIECYAERGWSGFSFETVSIRATVGRPALYRRWSGREELLIDAFRESTPTLRAPDHGNIRDDLTDIAMAHRQLMAGARGRAGLRLFIEREAVTEVFRTVSAETSAQRHLLILEALRRGQARGEVRSEADLRIASELLTGALVVDALDFNKRSHQVHSTVVKTVDTLLKGLGVHSPTDGASRVNSEMPVNLTDTSTLSIMP